MGNVVDPGGPLCHEQSLGKYQQQRSNKGRHGNWQANIWVGPWWWMNEWMDEWFVLWMSLAAELLLLLFGQLVFIPFLLSSVLMNLWILIYAKIGIDLYCELLFWPKSLGIINNNRGGVSEQHSWRRNKSTLSHPSVLVIIRRTRALSSLFKSQTIFPLNEQMNRWMEGCKSVSQSSHVP